MPSITLKYDSTSKSFSATSIKGFLPGDGQMRVVSKQYEYLDGSLGKKQLGFHRIFQIKIYMTDGDDLDFIGNFLNSTTQLVGAYSYTGPGGTVSEVDVGVVDTHETFNSTWDRGAEVGRYVNLVLEEQNIRVGWPQGAGTGYGFDYGDSGYGDQL